MRAHIPMGRENFGFRPREGNNGRQQFSGHGGRNNFSGGRNAHNRLRSKDGYGTEQDPVNCSFFLRIGACRHGENCPKKHNWPTFSSTVLFTHLWVPKKKTLKSKKETADHYDDFMEDLLEETLQYGAVEEVLTYQNRGDHMLGNTFVRFSDEDMAQACINGTTGRYYAGRRIIPKFSPVQDFENARCRDHQMGGCKRGHFCNFAHFQPVPRWINKHLSRTDAYDKLRRYRQKKKELLKNRKDGWPAFPTEGNRRERAKVLAEWNKLREEEKGKDATMKFPAVDPHAAKSGLNLFKP